MNTQTENQLTDLITNDAPHTDTLNTPSVSQAHVKKEDCGCQEMATQEHGDCPCQKRKRLILTVLTFLLVPTVLVVAYYAYKKGWYKKPVNWLKSKFSKTAVAAPSE